MRHETKRHLSAAATANYVAGLTDLRAVLHEGVLEVTPVTTAAFTQLLRGCLAADPGFFSNRIMTREILRRCQIAGVTEYVYGADQLHVDEATTAEQLTWRLLLRWNSVTVTDPDGDVLGFAGAISSGDEAAA